MSNWLYTLAEWTCTRDAYMLDKFENVKETMVSRFYRGISANEGLALLKEHSQRFNEMPVRSDRRFVVEYRLIAMTQIPDDTSPELLAALLSYEVSRESVERDLAP